LGKDATSGKWEIVSWVPASPDAPRVYGVGILQEPAGLAVSSSAIYVGDNKLRRILKISITADDLSGAAVGYRGPVAAITLDSAGGLYVYPGGSLMPLRLTIDAGCLGRGVLWGKVHAPKNLAVTWHRAHATITAGSSQSHFQFFTAAVKPPDPSSAAQPFGPEWDPKGLDVGDFFTGAGKTIDFWMGVAMFSDGSSTPALSQIYINFDQPTYLAYLPPLYREEGSCGDFLLRYLSLFESFFSEGEAEIRALPALFDPGCASPDFLPWLGSWMAIDWDERWSTPKGRDVIRKAFDLYGKRGTLEGLREAIELFAGVRVQILEPIGNTSWWGVPPPTDCAGDVDSSASSLGFTTAAMATEPAGAVVGISAVLDRSHLIREADYGKPLFEQTAHQFTVVVYEGQIGCPETLDLVREIIDREKPAHTIYEICTVQPRMQIGQQSRIGVDTIVAGTPSAVRLGDGGLRLGGEPLAGRRDQWRVGVNTRI
jgi:phage tail-like protein